MLSKYLRLILITRAIWIRIFICWCVGFGALIVDGPVQFDRRFQIRAPQSFSPYVVLVYVSPQDWADYHNVNRGSNRPARDLLTGNDTSLWSAPTWQKLLTAIETDQPKAVAVTLNLQNDLPIEPHTEFTALRDERVFWAVEDDSLAKATKSPAIRSPFYNSVSVALPIDDDHRVRRFRIAPSTVPHVLQRFSEKLKIGGVANESVFNTNQLINFRGPSGTFPSIRFADVLNGRLAPHFFRDKIVIIGARNRENHTFQTPLGAMTRAEVLANLTDNIEYQRTFVEVPTWIVMLYLLAMILLTLWFLFQYPQLVSMTVILGLTLAQIALSFWFFDEFYLWLPLVGPLTATFASYIVFTSYQLTLKENLTWRLEQERKNFFELETMKSNFVSLISHDLKTPISKIQAICDRMLASENADKMKESLTSIRRESVELHRYIQTILNISRVESQALKLQREAVDINELVLNVAERLRPLAHEKNIHIELRLEPLFAIEADSGLVQEVILNLAENAIKYSPNNSQVTIKSAERADVVMVTVVDEGPGISKDEQAFIFKKFYRGREHALRTKGTGLGLYLVKYFVELHGGSVFVESSPGLGLTIGFQLPIEGPKSEDTV
jgi:signal transduction histidine kinase